MFLPFLQDNLFQNPTDVSLNPTDSSTQQSIVTATTNNTSSTISFDPLSFFFDPDRIRTFIYQLNYFTLAWCIFYSCLFVADFFFYRLKYSDGEIDREKTGVSSLRNAFSLWISYMICWVVFVIYGYFQAISGLVIFVYIFKLLSADLPNILNIVHNNVGLNGIHPTYKKIVTPISKLLSLDFKK